MDIYRFNAELEDFCIRHLLNRKQIHNLQLLCEEVLVNLLFPLTEKVELSIGCTDDNRETEITFEYAGQTGNPLENPKPDQELSCKIVQHLAPECNFSTEAGSSRLRFVLKDNNSKVSS